MFCAYRACVRFVCVLSVCALCAGTVQYLACCAVCLYSPFLVSRSFALFAPLHHFSISFVFLPVCLHNRVCCVQKWVRRWYITYTAAKDMYLGFVVVSRLSGWSRVGAEASSFLEEDQTIPYSL